MLNDKNLIASLVVNFVLLIVIIVVLRRCQKKEPFEQKSTEPQDCVPTKWSISDEDFICPTNCGLPKMTPYRFRSRAIPASNGGKDCILGEFKS